MKPIIVWYSIVGFCGVAVGIEFDAGYIATLLVCCVMIVMACMNAVSKGTDSDTSVPLLAIIGTFALLAIAILVGAGVGSLITDDTAPKRPENRYTVRPRR